MTISTSPRHGSVTRYAVPLLTTVVATSMLAVTAPPAQAALKRADLTVLSATASRTTLAEGDTLVISHVVKNRGTAKAAATQTPFYRSGRHHGRDPDPADVGDGFRAPSNEYLGLIKTFWLRGAN